MEINSFSSNSFRFDPRLDSRLEVEKVKNRKVCCCHEVRSFAGCNYCLYCIENILDLNTPHLYRGWEQENLNIYRHWDITNSICPCGQKFGMGPTQLKKLSRGTNYHCPKCKRNVRCISGQLTFS